MSNLAERTRTRRGQLIEAGIPLIGLPDGKPVGVRDVCKAAGLTERYFYQAFGSRENYVKAVYDHVGTGARNAVIEVLSSDMTTEERARAAVHVFLTRLIDEPANGRVVFVGPTTEPVLGPYSALFAVDFVNFVKGSLSGNHRNDIDRHLSALAIVGALSALFTAFLHGSIGTTRERFTEYCVDLVLTSEAFEVA